MGGPRCVLLPGDQRPQLRRAIEEGGGELVEVGSAEALVWATPSRPDELRGVLDANPGIRWVQLPFAGIEPFVDVLDHDRLWTCGKGVYAEPVAEHALALALAGMRGIADYARQRSWSQPYGHNLLGARVTILGGGAITRSLLRLLGPFGAHITVVRNRPDQIDGANEVVSPEQLHASLDGTDLVVLALALTAETRHVIDAAALDALPSHAWLVNVARGGHVDTGALVDALRAGRIGGAALDVTDPEPLPDGHPLWELPNVVVTPHIGNTPEMGIALLTARVRENVERYARGERPLGEIDVDLGY